MPEPREGTDPECRISAGVADLLDRRPELTGIGISDLLTERWSQ